MPVDELPREPMRPRKASPPNSAGAKNALARFSIWLAWRSPVS